MSEIDSKAFEILVLEHHRRLLAYALALVPNPVVAEDLVQDAFVVAYKNLQRYDSSRSFGAWVRSILRNKYLEWVRHNKEFATDPERLNLLNEEHKQWDDDEEEPGMVMAALQSCLKKLPEAMYQVVDLFYMQRLSGAAAAHATGVEEATVRKRLQRGRQWLGDCIRKRLEAQQ